MAFSATLRRFGVVVSGTTLTVAALGGVASASPTGGTDRGATQAQSHLPNDQNDVHGKSDASNGKGNGLAKGDAPSQSSDSSTGVADTHQTDGTAGTSGDASTQQPLSNADKNSGGANGQCLGGPYCSTRDGSPSANGNGAGQATGKPCAGCVGKADNKNPKGQMPGGSDHNAGYECDRNHGIGKGNPAHTGCTGTTPVTTPTVCASGQVMVAGICVTPSTPQTTPDTTPDAGCTGGMVLLNGVCTTPQSTPATCPAGATMVSLACVLGESTSKSVPSTGTHVLGERVVRTPASVIATATSLPFTGAPTGELLLLAAAGLTAGGALTLAGRRRRV